MPPHPLAKEAVHFVEVRWLAVCKKVAQMLGRFAFGWCVAWLGVIRCDGVEEEG